MCISKKNCPVPFDQQPLNEYIALKKSFLFSWSTDTIKNYIFIISSIFIFLFILSGILIYNLCININNIYQFVLLDLFVSNLILLFIFLRIYLGWSYIVKRLLSATIFYEESGWYDGQIWVKSASFLVKDRLIGLYEIMPFVNRIKYTCFIFVSFLLFDYIFLVSFK
uniref:Ycf36 n=1 Tax=Bostrychia moritziana TaxID=103713 RepID=A0A1Z1M765_BOSMO|nr:hypothetical protein [Bostrychia moritziana]ARW61681.1 hypothetical protein [Bostrychia moritziana]